MAPSNDDQSQPVFGILLDREDLGFSAAHILVSDGELEKLSGHSYQLAIWLEGSLNEDDLLIDFRILKPILKNVIDRYNHATIVPTKSSQIGVTIDNETVFISHGQETITLPQSHCVFIDARNASTEALCRCILEEVVDKLLPQANGSISKIRIGVSESPGQRAYIERTFS